jgi:hypothetical protein
VENVCRTATANSAAPVISRGPTIVDMGRI